MMGFKSWNDREIRIIPEGIYGLIKAMLEVVPVVALAVTDILLSIILLICILTRPYNLSEYPFMALFFLLICLLFFCWKLWIWYQIVEDKEVS